MTRYYGSNESPAAVYLAELDRLTSTRDRQISHETELSAALEQIEVGLAALRGIVRAHNLVPSELNDRIEGLNYHESLALQVSMLRDLIGPSPDEHTKSPE